MNTRWSPFVKQLVVVGALIAGVWLLFRVRLLFAPLILALLLAYLASYPVDWTVRRTGWPRTPVVVGVLLSALFMLTMASVLFVPWTVGLLRPFGSTLVNVTQSLLRVTPRPIAITPTLTIDLGPFYSPVNEWLRSITQPDLSTVQNLQNLLFPFASGAATVVISAVSSLLWTIFVFVVSFYALKDAPLVTRATIASIPPAWRPEVVRLWREIALIWDSFVRGRLILSILVGLLVWAAMSILGVRNAAALGLLAGVLELIPGIGSFIAAIPAILIALILGSTWLPLPNGWFALLVALTYVLLNQYTNNYLLPRVVGSRMALHPAVIIVGAVAGAALAGVLGILLAAPVIASLRTLGAYALRKLFDQEAFPTPQAAPAREQLWAEQVRSRPVRAVLFDLDGTLIQMDNRLVEETAGRVRFIKRILPDRQRKQLVRHWLMVNEGWGSGLATVFDRLHLDRLVFDINASQAQWKGWSAPGDSVTTNGSLEALHTLAQRYPLGLITSRHRTEVEALLKRFELDGVFQSVVTRDSVRWLKPNPTPVRLAAKRLRVPPKQCVVVGDTALDVRAAKAAGALAVGVLCGFGEMHDFEEADLILDSPSQLLGWL